MTTQVHIANDEEKKAKEIKEIAISITNYSDVSRLCDMKITAVNSSRLTSAYPFKLTTAGFISMACMKRSIYKMIRKWKH